jgi:hypothetical protein
MAPITNWCRGIKRSSSQRLRRLQRKRLLYSAATPAYVKDSSIVFMAAATASDERLLIPKEASCFLNIEDTKDRQKEEGEY